MTSFTSFTLDSFKKRKELLHLFFIQVFVSIVLYYIVILADILIRTFYKTSITDFVNTSISNYWGAFFLILIFVSLLFAIALVLFTIRLMVFYQTKDISIMIAIGGVIEIIENFYLVQILLLCLAANVIGVVVGYAIMFLIVIVSEFIIPIQFSLVIPFPDYILIVIFLFFFFTSYMISGRLITTIVKRYHEDLIQDRIDFNNGKDDNIIARMFIWGRKNADGFIDLTTRISRLNIMRHSFVFLISLIINILYAFFLVSVLFGTVLVSDTTTNISYSGVGGDNTAMIVNKNFASFFQESFYLDSSQNYSNINFTSSFFSYSQVLPVLKSFNITQFDDRIITPKNVTVRNYSMNFDPNVTYNNGGGFLGNLYNLQPMVVALNLSNAIPFWNYYGQNPKNLTGQSIAVGEQFANWFRDTSKGDLTFNANSKTYFFVKSVLLDPLFKGNTVYVDMPMYQSLFKSESLLRNIIFIHVSSQDMINKLASAIQKVNPDLSVYSLNGALSHNVNFDNLISLYLLLVGVPLLIVYFILSDSYTKQIIEERKQQLNLIKVLGGGKDKYRSIILKEIDGFSIWGLSVGYLMAMYFLIQMTVPFPVVTVSSVIFSIAILVIPYYVVRLRLITKIDNLYNTFVEV